MAECGCSIFTPAIVSYPTTFRLILRPRQAHGLLVFLVLHCFVAPGWGCGCGRCVGRVSFWLWRSVTWPPPGGDDAALAASPLLFYAVPSIIGLALRTPSSSYDPIRPKSRLLRLTAHVQTWILRSNESRKFLGYYCVWGDNHCKNS